MNLRYAQYPGVLHMRASLATQARFARSTSALRLPKKFENERSDDRPDSSLSIGNRLESDVSCSAVNTTETYIKVNFYIYRCLLSDLLKYVVSLGAPS